MKYFSCMFMILFFSQYAYSACEGENCDGQECENQSLVVQDGMLDFCEPPSYGTYSIEKDGITWHFDSSVSFGQFINGDYWVLDKGKGVTIAQVVPAPNNDANGSMVNPEVGVQAYDKDIEYYDSTKAVKFPVVLNAGDSLVSTISKANIDINEYGNVYPSWYSSTKGLGHAELMRASVLTVVDRVPPFGSFRPPFVGNNKKMYNIRDIDSSILTKIKAPSSMPDISYYERGLERPWLMHLPDWTARKMHPVENMPNYHREVGKFLSDVSLILLTEKSTKKLLFGFIQTGIDHYYTIISGAADSATFEFQSIFTGLLLSDKSMANVWVDGKSQTVGRAADKFYFSNEKNSPINSTIVKSGYSWTGYNVMFRKKTGDTEHEHLHPSEWEQVANGGGIKQETYRQCCDSTPHFGMALASRILGAGKYWPSNALDQYMDRWVYESKNGFGHDVIKSYYPTFKYETRKYILGYKFWDEIYSSYSQARTSVNDVVVPKSRASYFSNGTIKKIKLYQKIKSNYSSKTKAEIVR